MYTWNQRTGQLIDGQGNVIACGYSGAGVAKNDPECQDVSGVGPIPRGRYTIVGEPFDSATHGPFCLRLEPWDGNEMHGRSGFLVHGDSVSRPGTASRGCIVLPRAARHQWWNSGDRQLLVVEGGSACP